MAKTTKKTTTPYTQNPDGTLSFELTIPRTSISAAYTESLREYASRLTLPGFRKGKAPLAMAEKALDRAELLAHSLEHAFPHVYADFLKTHSLQPLVDPEVTPKNMVDGEDWLMSVTTATFPDVKLGDYVKKIKAIKSYKDEKNKLPEIFDALLEAISFEISPVLVRAETKAALKRLSQQLSTLKLTLEDYAKSIKKSLDDLVKDYETTATTNLRLELILYNIANEQGIKPEERQKILDYLTKL